MPAAVEIPTRLRLDAAAVLQPGGDELVADAVREAATRALRTSADVVLGAGGARPVLEEPRFTWTGDGLGELDATRREGLEAAVMGALTAAVSAAEVVAPYGAEGPAPRPEPSEPVDPSRHAELLHRYVIPSYDDGGEETAVSIQFEDMPVIAGQAGPTGEMLATPDPRWSEADWVTWFLVCCAEAGQDVPASGIVGMLYADAAGGYGITLFAVTSITRDGVRRTEGYLRIYDLWEWQVDEHGRPRRAPIEIPPRGTIFLRAVGDTPTPESRLALKAQRVREQIGAALDAERDRLVAALGEEGFEELKRAEIERIASELTEDPAVQGYIDLVINGRAHLVTLTTPAGLPAGTVIPLVPYTQFVTQTLPGTGEGGEGRGAEGEEGTGTGEGEEGRGAEGEERAGAEPGGRIGAEGEAEKGGFVAVPGAEGAEEGALFPSVPGGETITCEPFLEEPPLSALGADGDRLREIIDRIAAKLAIQPCEYAGGFALSAAAAFGGRAGEVGQFSVTASDAFLQPPTAEGTANLGSVRFEPAPSPAIAFMRHIASVAPDITALVDATTEVYEKPEHHGKIGSFEKPISWIWRFRAEINGAMQWSVATMFGMTCRVLLLQLLRASANHLRGRLEQIDAYAELFEQALLPRLRRIEELIELRDALRAAGTVAPAEPVRETLPGGVPLPADAGTPEPATADEAENAWRGSRAELLDALGGPDASAAAAIGTDVPARGTIVWTGPGAPRIHDGRGRAWSMLELESGIVTRRGWVESLDPLVKQLVELDEVLARFDDPARGVRAELEALLREMLANNEEQTREVEDSWIYAFRAGRINESIPHATVPYTRYALGGIHLQAHLAIGDAFRGDPFYALGINALFGAELGRLGLISFFEFTGTLLLAIACPPLGTAAGVALAAYHLEEAEERERLYESLIDPELVITRAEVEQELFVARLGFALAIIPEAGTILRAGTRLGGAVARHGVRAGVRRAGRAVAAYLAEETIRSLRRGIVVAFLREIATDQAIEAVAQRIIGPIVAQIEREATVTGPVGGTEGAESVLERLALEAGVLDLPAEEEER